MLIFIVGSSILKKFQQKRKRLEGTKGKARKIQKTSDKNSSSSSSEDSGDSDSSDDDKKKK